MVNGLEIEEKTNNTKKKSKKNPQKPNYNGQHYGRSGIRDSNMKQNGAFRPQWGASVIKWSSKIITMHFKVQHRQIHVAWLLVVLCINLLLPNYCLCDENADNDGNDLLTGYGLGTEITTTEFDYSIHGSKKFGDKCESTQECGFPRATCDSKKKSCQCIEHYPITNHIDKCGKAAIINDSCFFNEQCEAFSFQTECRDGKCICRYEMSPIINNEGIIECKGKQESREPERYIDPAMIGILVAMALMFIIICVVLRLFSQARWRENRTIFNTPNPRLMNVSLLRDSKLLHGQERRGSRMSVRMPSRQPSMASLRAHSPNPSLGKQGSRRGSRGSSNASATSTRSNRSLNNSNNNNNNNNNNSHDPKNPNNNKPQIINVPVIESVTVEVAEPKP